MKEYTVVYTSGGHDHVLYFDTIRGANDAYMYSVGNCEKVALFDGDKLVKVWKR